MNKVVMILGASRYYVRSIISAQEAGYRVIATDRDPNAPGFHAADDYEAVDISDVDGSIQVAQRHNIDGVVAINDFGVKTAAAISERLGIPGLTPQAAEYATSKAYMRKIWAAAKVPSANFRVVKTLPEAFAAVDSLNCWPLIVKPADSSGGGSRGVSRIENREQVAEALRFAQSFYKDQAVVIEEFLDGTEHSIETITYDGHTYILAVGDNEKLPPPYRVNKSINYPTSLEGEDLHKVHQAAIAAVGSLGIERGPAHIELCFTQNGPKLFEVGARCGGGAIPDPIVPYLTGIEMFKESTRIAVGDEPHNLVPLFQRGCTYRWITPHPGRVKAINGLEQIQKWDGILDCEVLVQPGGVIPAVRVGGDRTGFIIAGGDNRQEAIALANRAEQTIRFDYISNKSHESING